MSRSRAFDLFILILMRGERQAAAEITLYTAALG